MVETDAFAATLSDMSADKSGEDRIRQQAIQEATLVARAVQLDEAERRLRQLEERGFARHTQTMTWILTAISSVMGLAAVLVTILAYSSKSTADREADKLDKEFNQMKSDFQQQFAAFAGEALKKPKVEISITSGPLTNQVFQLKRVAPSGNLQTGIYPLFIKNVGQKPTGPISIYLYSSVQLAYNGSQRWEPDASNDQEFPFKFRFQLVQFSPLELAPGEPWSLGGNYSDGLFNWNDPTNMASCKLVVFYGGESPAEARFQVKK